MKFYDLVLINFFSTKNTMIEIKNDKNASFKGVLLIIQNLYITYKMNKPNDKDNNIPICLFNLTTMR